MRRGSGLTQSELAKRAGPSQATLSAYERGLKSPTLGVLEQIIEATGYELALATKVRFVQHFSPRVHSFWVPDRLWRAKLPECFVKVHLDDGTRLRGTRRQRREPARSMSRRRMALRDVAEANLDHVPIDQLGLDERGNATT